MRLILTLERAFGGVSTLKATSAELSATRPQQEFRRELAALVAQIAAFDAIERVILRHEPCADPGPRLDDTYAALEAHYDELRRTDGFHAYPVADVARFDSIVLALRELSQALRTLSPTVTLVNQAAADGAPPPTAAAPALQTRPWFPPLDGRRLRYGIKATLSVLIALLGQGPGKVADRASIRRQKKAATRLERVFRLHQDYKTVRPE